MESSAAPHSGASREELQSFLLSLSDKLRALEDVKAIQSLGTRLLADRFQVQRCVWAEVHDEVSVILAQYADGLPPFPENVPTPLAAWGDAFLSLYRQGGTLGVDDIEHEPRLTEQERAMFRASGIRSFTGASVSRAGRIAAGFALHATSPRHWSEADLRLQAQAADRIWVAAERAAVTTALRQSEARYREAAARAEEASRMKDEFLAMLSHELRTPVAASLLWVDLLRRPGQSEERREQAIDALAQSIKSQSRLIEDLLELSRLRAGKASLVWRSTDVHRAARFAVDLIRPAAEAKGLSIALHMAPALPYAMLDPDRVQQILANLLSNAVKFTPSGGRVDVRVQRSEEQLHIEVADTGCGVAPEFLPKIFDRFTQGQPVGVRQHSGLGIGLALARSLAELHGGTIYAESKGIDQGATFRVSMPWRPAVSPPSSPGYAPCPTVTDELRGLRVLLVEDDESTRSAVAMTLTQAGANVTAVASGEAGLRAVSEDEAAEPVDIIVSDIGLPDMTGNEMIRRIADACRTRGCEPIPACALSAHAREEDRKLAIAAGFDLYLAKPVSADELLEAVRDLHEMTSNGGHATP